MNATLADVALPLPIPQLFTYSIPPHLESVVVLGSGVVVPFGRKILSGIVVAFPAVKPDVTVKAIKDLTHIQPLVGKNELTLASWISEYYHAPLGESLRLFLPAGFRRNSQTVISLSNESTAEFIASPLQQEILILLKSGPMALPKLQNRLQRKNIYAVLKELISFGIINITETASSTVRPKTALFFRKTSHDQSVNLKNKKQLETWNAILSQSNDEVEVSSFLKSSKSSLSVLKSLEKKNMITLFRNEIERRAAISEYRDTPGVFTFQLNTEQQSAVNRIAETLDGNSSHIFLLHGITGSGKTQVYIESIRAVLERKKQAIVLIPEISLTPQTVRRFREHFGDAVVWMHSRMSDGERVDAWKSIREGKYSIAIGPRSALFAPMDNIGLIVVDEEHDSSYKQFDAQPRYNARDVALMRASIHQAVVVLGSATPSIESFANATGGKYSLLSLPHRADHAVLPPVVIVNMVEERQRRYAEAKLQAKEIGKKAFEHLSRSISRLLEEKINDRLEKKEGIILLQNRRGFAPFIECKSCGHVEQCDHCSVTMTYHAAKKHMRCHYCGIVKPAPTSCRQCGGFEFLLNGFGTQRVEEELMALFPAASVLRMDMDTTARRGSHEKILNRFGSGEADILLGTQMVAKGLDFPRVTLVGVISADTQMMLPDFRSAEKTFQLLTQVAGRAGRSKLAGEVIIQTSQPLHYALKHVQDHDVIGFYKEEMEYRQSLHYPPFSRIIVIECKGKNEKNVEQMSAAIGKLISSSILKEDILGPAPAVLSKIKNDYRWQIIIKARKETDPNGTRARGIVARVIREQTAIAKSLSVKIIVDVDPAGIL